MSEAQERPDRDAAKPQVVVVTVEGGVVQNVECPEGVRVVVRDYDTEGTDADHLSRDEDGNECVEAVWG
jgi:hypothetical protein